MDVEGDFNSIEHKKSILSSYDAGSIGDYYEYYEFWGENCLCRVVPTRKKGIISIYKIIGDIYPKAVGKTYSADGKVTAIT